MTAGRDVTLTKSMLAHRDVKLENIFIAEDGRVRLGDFGLTMSMKQELAISPVGTVEYMAPEVPRCRLSRVHPCRFTIVDSHFSKLSATECRSITPFLLAHKT